MKTYMKSTEQILQEWEKMEENFRRKVEKMEINIKKFENLVAGNKKYEREHGNLIEFNSDNYADLGSKLAKSDDILHDIGNLLVNENFKDITIKVHNEEIKLHKFLLAARSPTFADFFTENPHAVELNFCDVSIEAFKILIDFIYNNRLPQDDDDCEVNSMELFQMGGRMKVEKLKNFAAAKLMHEINPENAFEILTIANKHEHEGLKLSAFEEIKKMFPGRKIREELANQPEMVKVLIDAKNKKLRAEQDLEIVINML